MYFRIKKHKSKEGEVWEYLCVVEGHRENGKVRQKMLANLERLDHLRSSGNLRRLAKKLNTLGDKRMLVDLAKDIKSPWAKHFGVTQVLKAVWKRLDISRILLEEGEASRQGSGYRGDVLYLNQEGVVPTPTQNPLAH